MSVEVIHAPALGAVAHGFLGRRGGVSTGALAGLNVGYGSGDERDAIAENRRRAVDAVLPGAALATVHQVHSALCVEAKLAWPHDTRPHADAMVTATPGLLLGILTADCAPVLFADRRGEVIGAAHAGWRGALAGVTDATIAAMEALGARREHVAAAVGPCISRDSYEVDDGFRARLLEDDGDNERFFTVAATGQPHFDLPGYVAHRLVAAGVGTVATLGLDTYGDAERFFSFRRATHGDEPDYGRQLSLIGISNRA